MRDGGERCKGNGRGQVFVCYAVRSLYAKRRAHVADDERRHSTVDAMAAPRTSAGDEQAALSSQLSALRAFVLALAFNALHRKR